MSTIPDGQPTIPEPDHPTTPEDPPGRLALKGYVEPMEIRPEPRHDPARCPVCRIRGAGRG